MANFSTERGSELPVSVRCDDQRTATNPCPVLFKRIWSTIIVWIARQNPPESQNISIGNIEHGSNNPSEKGGQDAISIRDADEYTTTSSSSQGFVSCKSMNDADDVDSSIDNGEYVVFIDNEEFAADRQSAEYVACNAPNLIESTTTRIDSSDDGSSLHGPRATAVAMNIVDVNEFEPANSQNYPVSTSTRTEYAGQDSGFLTETSGQTKTSARDEEHTTSELQSYSNPKFAKYFYAVYSVIVGALSIKGLTEKHSPFHDHIPFMIISIGACLLATLNLAVMSCIHDRFKSSSHRRFSAALYYIFHILCVLALCSPLPVLFNPHH